MSVTKVQTEIIYEVIFEDKEYSVIHTEDANLGVTSWDVFDDTGHMLADEAAIPIIEYTIENMEDSDNFAFS